MIKVWNGTDWATVDAPFYWNGTTWVHHSFKTWDGEVWQPSTQDSGNVSVASTFYFDVAAPTPSTTWITTSKTFGATWGGTFKGNNSLRTDTSDLYQGYYAAINGNQKALIGFNFGSFPAGSVIVSIQLTMYAAHWYYNGGGTVLIGTHVYPTKPGSWGTGNITEDRQRYAWSSKTGSRTITLSNTIGQEILNGTTKGIALGPSPDTSNYGYYGYFVGTGNSRPSVKITYKYMG